MTSGEKNRQTKRGRARAGETEDLTNKDKKVMERKTELER